MNSPPKSLFGSLILPFLLASCAVQKPVEETIAAAPPKPKLYQWNDDGGTEPVKVRINLNAQRAYFTRGDRPIGWTYVATGRAGYKTPPGTYRITEKIVDKRSNRYGWIENANGDTIDGSASSRDPVPSGGRFRGAPMPYWMRLTSYGIGMHGGYIPNPGSPASHGCIRLPKPLAPILFDAVKVGTPVKVEYGPTPSNFNVPPAPDSPPAGSRTVSSAPVDDPPEPPTRPRRMRNGRQVVSPSDPWIVR